MHWFKIHHGFSTDKKLGLISHQIGVPRAIINAIVIDMLEYASNCPDRGSIVGYDNEVAAYNLGILHEQIVTVRNALLLRSFVTEDKISKWEQYQSIDRTNAERQARYRNNKKQKLIDSVTVRNALRNTEERRGDKNITPIVPIGDFDSFWKIYPLKKGKQKALEKYSKAIKQGTEHDVIYSGAIRYRDDPKRKPDFTMHASTWLHGKHWEDEQEQKPLRRAFNPWKN